MINVFQPSLGAEELAALEEVFRSNWIGKGKKTDQFEAAFAEHLGAGRAQIRSVTCCTEGLFQVFEILGLGAGDEVILPSVSFVGAANAVASRGARVVFCDVDPRTLNATAEHIAAKITPQTRAVMILHYGGVPADLDPIVELTGRKGLALVEDSACSVSSRYKGKACGTFGNFSSWSFDAMKILVTGDGAMLYCRDPEAAQRAEEQIYLGLVSKSGLASAQTVKGKWWEFSISGFGRRAIMNDVTSAIGLVQLGKLQGFIARRRQVHAMYDLGLADLPWLRLPPAIPPHCESSYYFYWIQTQKEQVRDDLAVHLKDDGIYSTFRYFPLHWVGKYGCPGPLPNTERAANTTLCIPLHHSLTDAEVEHIVGSIRRFGAHL
jgi:dTDP-4-amino-4,6-dideoxygalactose transaminase